MRKLLPAVLLAAACSGGGAAPASAPAPMAGGAWPFELPRAHPPRPTTAEITAADLATRLFLIADDSMLGRNTPSKGRKGPRASRQRAHSSLPTRPSRTKRLQSRRRQLRARSRRLSWMRRAP